MKHVIQSDSEEGFWSNKQGWVFSVLDATVFTEQEHREFPFLPGSQGRDSKWMIVDYSE